LDERNAVPLRTEIADEEMKLGLGYEKLTEGKHINTKRMDYTPVRKAKSVLAGDGGEGVLHVPAL
jgi:hypothetical protein